MSIDIQISPRHETAVHETAVRDAAVHETPARAQLPEWNEPAGLTARGTLIVLAGRGEAAGVYERFGRRLSADSYRVRVVEDATLDLSAARAQISAYLDDATLPEPRVLVGSDSGAALVLATLGEAATGESAGVATGMATGMATGVAAAVMVGLPVASATAEFPAEVTAHGNGDGDGDAEARSACPIHRRTLADPRLVTVGALNRPLPAELIRVFDIPLSRVPILAIHGDADTVAPVAAAVDFYRSLGTAEILTIAGGRHDALNDVSHRSVAAAIVLFLERLRLRLADTNIDRAPESAHDLPAVLNAAPNAVQNAVQNDVTGAVVDRVAG